MSAFVVSDQHLHALLHSAQSTRQDPLRWEGESGNARRSEFSGRTFSELDYTCMDSVGRMLLAENIRSFRHRYQDNAAALEETPPAVEAYRCPNLHPRVDPVTALKLLACYEYQASETPDWEQTEAFRFCRSLQETLIHRLPGYKEAAWEI